MATEPMSYLVIAVCSLMVYIAVCIILVLHILATVVFADVCN